MKIITWLDRLPYELQEIIRIEYIKLSFNAVNRELVISTNPAHLGTIPLMCIPIIAKLLSYFPDMIYENVESYYLILDWFVDYGIVSQSRIDHMVLSQGFPDFRGGVTETEERCEQIAFTMLNRPLCQINKTFYTSLLSKLNYQELLCFKRYVERRCNFQS